MSVQRRFISQSDLEALEERTRRAALVNDEPSKTIQGPTHDADINVIAKAFGLNARNMVIPPEVFDPANYMDMSEAPDLQTALNLVRDAQEQFAKLPAELRAMFNHDPVALWDFVQNPANGQKAVELGLLVSREPIVAPGASGEVSDAPGA